MTKDRVKIAFLVNDIDTGGTARSTRLLVENMDHSRFHIVVVACGPGPAGSQIGKYADEYHNLKIGSYPNLRKMKKGKVREDFFARFRLTGWLTKSIWQLTKWLRMENVDIVHTNSVQFSLIAGVAGRLARVPSIWHIRSPQTMAWRRGGPFLVEGYLAGWLATKFIANSHFTAGTFHKSWKKNTVVIWNATGINAIIEHQHPAKLREIANVSKNEKLVGVVSVIERRKGIDRFIKMASKLARNRDDVRFVIVGGDIGPDQGRISRAIKADLVKLAEELGVAEKICFTGNIDNAPHYIGDMDAFFMCSRPGTETFGLVVIEAMVASVPVVAFENDAMGEILEDGKTGFLVPEGDIDLAAERISMILDDKALADNIKKAALTQVKNNFDIPVLIDNVQKLYREILQDKELSKAGHWQN